MDALTRHGGQYADMNDLRQRLEPLRLIAETLPPIQREHFARLAEGIVPADAIRQTDRATWSTYQALHKRADRRRARLSKSSILPRLVKAPRQNG
jgi:hypothetical protein